MDTDACIGYSDFYKLVTMLSTTHNLEKVMSYGDIVVTCAQSVGEVAPILLSDDLIKSMKERSVLIDLAIDSGGNSTTSRPTNHGSPTYVKYNVIHYCVPNISSIVARSASYAFNNAIIPHLTTLLDNSKQPVLEKLKTNDFWKEGIAVLEGQPIHESLIARLKRSSTQSNK